MEQYFWNNNDSFEIEILLGYESLEGVTYSYEVYL